MTKESFISRIPKKAAVHATGMISIIISSFSLSGFV
jgi:hypothetical protein